VGSYVLTERCIKGGHTYEQLRGSVVGCIEEFNCSNPRVSSLSFVMGPMLGQEVLTGVLKQKAQEEAPSALERRVGGGGVWLCVGFFWFVFFCLGWLEGRRRLGSSSWGRRESRTRKRSESKDCDSTGSTWACEAINYTKKNKTFVQNRSSHRQEAQSTRMRSVKEGKIILFGSLLPSSTRGQRGFKSLFLNKLQGREGDKRMLGGKAIRSQQHKIGEKEGKRRKIISPNTKGVGASKRSAASQSGSSKEKRGEKSTDKCQMSELVRHKGGRRGDFLFS